MGGSLPYHQDFPLLTARQIWAATLQILRCPTQQHQRLHLQHLRGIVLDHSWGSLVSLGTARGQQGVKGVSLLMLVWRLTPVQQGNSLLGWGLHREHWSQVLLMQVWLHQTGS